MSAKIVRLLRRVAGVRHILTTESRLLSGFGGLACGRTGYLGDPISPTNPSGATNKLRDPGLVSCAESLRHARPRGSAERPGGGWWSRAAGPHPGPVEKQARGSGSHVPAQTD